MTPKIESPFGMRKTNRGVAIAGQNRIMLFTFGVLILLVTLLGLASSAQPAVIKSVQSGTTSFGGGSTTVTITSVDTTKAFLLFGISEPDQTSAWDYLISGQITNATTLTFARPGNNKTVTVYWYVAEFSSGVSVQRGSANMRGKTTVNQPITAVDTTKSFPIVSYRDSGTNNLSANCLLKSKITSATNLELALRANGDGTSVAEWQVVTYTDASVTSGDISFATGSSIGQDLVRGQITNGTTLTFDRSATGVALNLTWYLVQFTDGTTVQCG
ncbi:MAG: hypothetical protein H6Q48_1149 [Deltaproteobacteria bacterium]|jgi:hypothetical protein|nr:hypothetical protein [Deltaproteobacteria bacterium]